MKAPGAFQHRLSYIFAVVIERECRVSRMGARRQDFVRFFLEASIRYEIFPCLLAFGNRSPAWLFVYGRNLTVTWFEQVWVPASHTLYVKLARPVVPVESL